MNFDAKSGQLLHAIQSRLEGAPLNEAVLRSVLDMTLAHFNCVVGTLHRLNPESGLLELIAARGIPDAIMDRVGLIPIGKGMAGLAAERMEPVQVCNLQTDDSGVAKPGAKLTEMEGSVAAPIIIDGKLVGTIGVAKPQSYEFTEEERELLMAVGRTMAEHFE